MELRAFITNALVDIVGGVADAQSEFKYGEVVPTVNKTFQSVEAGISEIQSVDFEVAVTTESRKGSEAGLSVVAAVIGGAVKGQSDAGTEHVARLKFRVPVKLPVHKPSTS